MMFELVIVPSGCYGVDYGDDDYYCYYYYYYYYYH